MANETIKKTQFDSSKLSAKTPLRLNAENKATLFTLIDKRKRGQTVQERVTDILAAEDKLRLTRMELVRERTKIENLSMYNAGLERSSKEDKCKIGALSKHVESLTQECVKMAFVGFFAGAGLSALIGTLF